MIPYDYADECGPTVLAALAGIEREEAARMLWATRWLWSDPRRAAGEGIHGTTEDGLADAFVRLGFDVEDWSGDGRLRADPTVLRLLLGRRAHGRATEVRRIQQGAPEASTGSTTATTAPREPYGPPLTEWLDRHRGGGWWAVCVTKDTGAHVLPTYGCRILVDEEGQLERYGEWEAYRSLRIFKPEGVAA